MVVNAKKIRRVIVGAAVLIVCASFWHLEVTKALTGSDVLITCADLVNVLGIARPSEGRLSCELPHAYYEIPNTNLTPRQRKRYKSLRDKVEGSTSVQGLRSRALLSLSSGQPSQAVDLLERALIVEPNNIEVAIDIVAASISKYSVTGSIGDLLSALTIADRISRKTPRLPEVRFNLAVILDKLSLANESRKAWEDYLEIDSSSGWADEAREHLRRLMRQPDDVLWANIVSQLDKFPTLDDKQFDLRELSAKFPQHLRLYIEGELMVKWAKAAQHKQETVASSYLRFARALLEQVPSMGCDDFLRDELNRIDYVSSNKEIAGQRASLIEGHLAFGRGMQLYSSDAFQESRVQFRLAEAALSQSGSPFQLLATFYLALTEFYVPDYKSSSARLNRLHSLLQDKKYPYIMARVLSMLGLIRFVEGESAQSLAYYTLSLNESIKADELVNAAYTHFLIGRAYSSIGDEQEAWRHRIYALAATNGFVDPRRIYSVLVDASEAALEGGSSSAALYFQSELISFLSRWANRPALVAESLIKRSKIYASIGRIQDSYKDLQTAKVLSARVPDENFRYRIVADIMSARATDVPASRSEGVILSLTEAIKYFSGKGHDIELPSLYSARARLHLEDGKVQLAERDFDLAIKEVGSRGVIPLEDVSATQFDHVQSMVDEMILLQQDRLHNKRKAFLFAELARFGAFYGYFDRPRLVKIFLATSKLPEMIQGVLPRDAGLVEYKLLDDRLLIWVVSSSGEHLVVEKISARSISDMVEEFRWSLAHHLPPRLYKKSNLYEAVLLKPLKLLRDKKSIIIVPDKALNSLPFAALKDPESGRFVAEDFVIRSVPSSRLYVQSMRRQKIFSRKPSGRMLIVGSPKFDRKLFPSLPSLPGAILESRELGLLFPGATLLLGDSASKDRFLSYLNQYDVIHFAGHSIGNYRHPFRSALLFAAQSAVAGAGSGGGQLSAAEITRLNLIHCRLVILSSCASVSGLPSYGNNFGSLGEAFLVAGVPAVVGSLWDVGDQMAKGLLNEMHKARSGGMDVAAALRSAQMQYIHSSDKSKRDPFVWSSFEVMGAEASN